MGSVPSSGEVVDPFVGPVPDEKGIPIFFGEMAMRVVDHTNPGSAYCGKLGDAGSSGQVVLGHPVKAPRVRHAEMGSLERHENAIVLRPGIVVRGHPVEASVHRHVPAVRHLHSGDHEAAWAPARSSLR